LRAFQIRPKTRENKKETAERALNLKKKLLGKKKHQSEAQTRTIDPFASALRICACLETDDWAIFRNMCARVRWVTKFFF